LNVDLVFVQGGTFYMGCTDEQDNDCWVNERPDHQVTVSDFYIGKYEVTQAQWKAVMGRNPSYFKGNNLPVENVSWNEVQEFIQKLNAKTGKQYRLPTEAEWEFAARGGIESKGYKYSGSNMIGDVVWYSSNSSSKTHDAGKKQANELGLYDMSGNVWEWCSDWYNEDYYKTSPTANPTGPNTVSSRVLRGGSWISHAQRCRVSLRDFYTPGNRIDYIGFRLALIP